MKSYLRAIISGFGCLCLGWPVYAGPQGNLSAYDKLPMVELQAQVSLSAKAFQKGDSGRGILLLAPASPVDSENSAAGHLDMGWRLLLVGRYLVDHGDPVHARLAAVAAVSYLTGPVLVSEKAGLRSQGLELAGQVEELVLKDLVKAVSHYDAAVKLDPTRKLAQDGIARINGKSPKPDGKG